MDFFEQQAKAHRKTRWLIVYFSLAVISMIVMVYALALPVSGYVGLRSHSYAHYLDYGDQPQFSFWDGKLFAGVALGTLAVIFCGSCYKTMALSGGGGAVAESLGGR